MEWVWIIMWPLWTVGIAWFFYKLGWEDGVGDERIRPKDW